MAFSMAKDRALPDFPHSEHRMYVKFSSAFYISSAISLTPIYPEILNKKKLEFVRLWLLYCPPKALL